MEDLIRRSDAIKTCINIINTRTDKRVGIRGGTTPAEEETIKIIYERVPTFEPKRGEWIYDMNQYYKCTNCGHLTLMPDSGSVFVPDWDEYHFCPNCGALMRERREP